MALHDLFPTPQQLTQLGQTIDLHAYTIAFTAAAALPALAQRGLDVVQVTQPTTATAYPINVQIDPADPAWTAVTYAVVMFSRFRSHCRAAPIPVCCASAQRESATVGFNCYS